MRIYPDRNKLIRLYCNEQKTLPEIAKLYGVSYPAIRQWFIKLNIPRRSFSDAQMLSHAPNLNKAELERLYNVERKSQSEIAKLFGITQSAVKNRMQVFGIKARDKANFGNKNGMFGKTHTQEVRERYRQRNAKIYSDPSVRQRIAEQTAKQIAEGRTGKSFNRLESKYAEKLKEQGIEFIWQYRINRYVYDFFIPKTNTLIELHGTFWHADPRIYDHSKFLYPVQKRNLENDVKKAEFAKRNGYNLAVIWEKDV